MKFLIALSLLLLQMESSKYLTETDAYNGFHIRIEEQAST
jgi:hypothetical protein